MFDSECAPLNGSLFITKSHFTTQVGKASRACALRDRVKVYRNLNKPDYYSLMACEGQDKGRVIGYAKSVKLANPRFKVSERARQRVRRRLKRGLSTHKSRHHEVPLMQTRRPTFFLLEQYQAAQYEAICPRSCVRFVRSFLHQMPDDWQSLSREALIKKVREACEVLASAGKLKRKHGISGSGYVYYIVDSA